MSDNELSEVSSTSDIEEIETVGTVLNSSSNKHKHKKKHHRHHRRHSHKHKHRRHKSSSRKDKKSHKHKSRSRHRSDSSSEGSENEQTNVRPSESPADPASGRHRHTGSDMHSKTSSLSKVQQSAAALVAAAAAALSEDDSDDDLELVEHMLEGSAKVAGSAPEKTLEKIPGKTFSAKGEWNVDQGSNDNHAIAGTQRDCRGVQINENGHFQTLTINVTNDKANRQGYNNARNASPPTHNIDSDSNLSSARETRCSSIPPPEDIDLNSSDMMPIDDINLEDLMKQKAALQAVLGAYMSDGGEDSDVSAHTPPPPVREGVCATQRDDTNDTDVMLDAELEAIMDLPKKLKELRNKVDQERINVSSGSEKDYKERKKHSKKEEKKEDPKVVTILDSDEEEELAKKKRKDERRSKKRKRSSWKVSSVMRRRGWSVWTADRLCLRALHPLLGSSLQRCPVHIAIC